MPKFIRSVAALAAKTRFGVVFGSTALVLAGTGVVACQHSDIVKNAERGAGVTAPRYLYEGQNPSLALPFKPAEVVLPASVGTPPFTDHANRMSCGNSPIRDLYETDPGVYDEAQKLLFQMTIEAKVKQLTGLPPPSYDDSNR